jgi:hypothetical protein
MDLIVDHSRQEMQAIAIDNLVSPGMIGGIDIRDLVILDQHIRPNNPFGEYGIHRTKESLHASRQEICAGGAYWCNTGH